MTCFIIFPLLTAKTSWKFKKIYFRRCSEGFNYNLYNPFLPKQLNSQVKSLNYETCLNLWFSKKNQENDVTEKKDAFRAYLEEDVVRTDASGSGLVKHFDGNLWAGENIVPGDPRKQNRNGKLFEDFLLRNPQLTVVDSLPLCKGLITRRRLREGKLEESILDFFVVCAQVLPYIISMEIDESKKYVLTNYEQARKVSDTDHATEILDVDMEILVEKPWKRREIFNFKDRESQKRV